MIKFRELFGAGAFVQRADGSTSSFTSVNVASSFIGNPNIRGIATMNSGTTVVSVAATGIVSGDIIMVQPVAYLNARTEVASASQFFTGLIVGSVTTGAFQILAIGSRAPIANLPIGWFKVA